MQHHIQTVKYVADAAGTSLASGGVVWSIWLQGPTLAAWASFLYFAIRGGVWVAGWWRARRGSCRECGGHRKKHRG